MHFGTDRPRRVGENVVPLINIVFLLLIFFMLAGTLERPDLFDVELPTTRTQPYAAPAPQAPLVLTVTSSGDLAIDGASLPRTALVDALSRQRDRTAPLRLRADARLPARVLLPLLDDVRAAGVTEIALVTIDAP